MTKIDLVRQEMMKALKAGETQRKEALSLLLSALKKKNIDKRADLTEEEENAVVFKEIKEAQEAIDSAAGRADIIEEAKLKIAVYTEFAPKRMGEEEVKALLADAMRELGIEKPSPQDKGKPIKAVMQKAKGTADGGTISKIVDVAIRG